MFHVIVPRILLLATRSGSLARRRLVPSLDDLSSCPSAARPHHYPSVYRSLSHHRCFQGRHHLSPDISHYLTPSTSTLLIPYVSSAWWAMLRTALGRRVSCGTPITPAGRSLLSTCESFSRCLKMPHSPSHRPHISQVAHLTRLLQDMALLLFYSGHDGATHA